jgi:hemoglobin-like flavoprotein
MGGGSSTDLNDPLFKGKTIQDIAYLMMPVYYSEDNCSPSGDDLQMVASSWSFITDQGTAEYVEKYGNDTPPLVTFYENFYKRLFDISPLSKNLFKNDMTQQGKMLVKVISLALSLAGNPGKFTEALEALAKRHFKYNVKAVEYGLVGEVLLWSLALVIGDTEYSAEMNDSWVRVYNLMLKIIVPVAVECEMNGEKVKREDL